MTERGYTRIRTVKNLFRYGSMWYPHRLGIEAVSTCNRRCYYCVSKHASKGTELVSGGVYTKFCERVEEFRWTGYVTFNGYGEPLQSDMIPILVRQVKCYAPKCLPVIYTNGDYLTKGVADALFMAGVHKIVVTRHSPVTQSWDHRISALLEGFGGGMIEVRTLQLQDLLNLGGHVNVRAPKRERCNIPMAGIQVWQNGDASFCCCDTDRTHIAGNVMTHSFREIWNNPHYREVRNKIRRGIIMLDLCKRCMAGGGVEQ